MAFTYLINASPFVPVTYAAENSELAQVAIFTNEKGELVNGEVEWDESETRGPASVVSKMGSLATRHPFRIVSTMVSKQSQSLKNSISENAESAKIIWSCLKKASPKDKVIGFVGLNLAFTKPIATAVGMTASIGNMAYQHYSCKQKAPDSK